MPHRPSRAIAAPGAGPIAAQRAAMFDGVARRYDRLNRIISLGLDRRWRRRAAAALGLDGTPAPRVLDLACGTGDLALTIARRYPDARIVGIDPSEEMLAGARRKAERRGVALELLAGVAEALPLEDSEVDAVAIGFGLRNVEDRERSLSEMFRVLRPGGRVVILELTEPRGPGLAALARFHIHHVVPRIGSLLTGRAAYRYLEQSIAAFPPVQQISAELRRAGAERVLIEPMCFGAVHLVVGFKEAAG